MESKTEACTAQQVDAECVPAAGLAPKELCTMEAPWHAKLCEGGDPFAGVTVGQLLSPGAVVCKLRLHYDLGDAASALAASRQTAAVVADGEGNVVALLTENDVMRALFEGVLPSHKLGDWLDSGMARGADLLVQRLTVRPCIPLSEVAERMVANALAGNYACHHVLVQESGKLYGLLSSLDMVQALCRPDMWDSPRKQGKEGLQPAPTEAVVNTCVEHVMKPRFDVFTCLPTDTMRDVVKVLLMTQQNSALVVDEEGIYGIITPRDAVKAFSEGVSSSIIISQWLSANHPDVANRLIDSQCTLQEAAAVMTSRGVNHLIVQRHGSQEAVGTVSSLDLAACTNKRWPLLRSMSRWSGPTVGDIVGDSSHVTAMCQKGTTLREAAELLCSSGRTSTALALSDDTAPLRLLTENDLMRAYIYGWERDRSAESWMLAKLVSRASVPQHLLVPPSVRLTEAASQMLSAGQPGGEQCHHLVVKAKKGVKSMPGGWLGVFSALDVARALSKIHSELEVAKCGADQTPVVAVMKPIEVVPICRPTDTILSAFQTLEAQQQNALVVADDNGTRGLLTVRYALQALAEGTPHEVTVEDFLRGREAIFATPSIREIAPSARLLDAAAIMTMNTVHHLLVVEPNCAQPVGVLSALDLVRAVASIHSQCPFTSLGWLWSCRGPAACTIW